MTTRQIYGRYKYGTANDNKCKIYLYKYSMGIEICKCFKPVFYVHNTYNGA